MEWVATLLGGASRQPCAATFPPDRFCCLLDALPLHLIPRKSSVFPQERSPFPLWLDPSCLICPAGQLPEELAAQPDLVAGFALQGAIAWVRDSVSGSLLPFWLGSRLESAIGSLRPGQDARALLSQEDCRVLLAAGVLRQSDSSTPWPPATSQKELRKIYSDNGYAAVPGLIHPFQVAALRRYYRYLLRRGRVPLGDPQCRQRYVAHNEPVARFFHHQLAKVVGAVAGELVKPSYVYMASYVSGAELKKHLDRDQCEFSISLCVDFSPEPQAHTPWPLLVETPEGIVTVHQSLGDGLFYRGTRLPHYREILGEGLTSTSIFFHYVSAGFTGPLA